MKTVSQVLFQFLDTISEGRLAESCRLVRYRSDVVGDSTSGPCTIITCMVFEDRPSIPPEPHAPSLTSLRWFRLRRQYCYNSKARGRSCTTIFRPSDAGYAASGRMKSECRTRWPCSFRPSGKHRMPGSMICLHGFERVKTRPIY